MQSSVRVQSLTVTQALKFEAYFEENIPHSREQNRVRKCNIYYYLEDGTMMIEEPKIENSGMPQGILLGRNKVQNRSGKTITWEDFQIGDDLSIYGVKYHITDCDPYTRVSSTTTHPCTSTQHAGFLCASGC